MITSFYHSRDLWYGQTEMTSDQLTAIIRPGALAADPHPYSDEAADDADLERPGKPAESVDLRDRANQARRIARAGPGIDPGAWPADSGKRSQIVPAAE